MLAFSRNSKSMIANWWWTVDKPLLILICLLLGIGAFLSFSASPAVALGDGFSRFHFVKRQFLFLPIAVCGMLLVSMMNLRNVRKIAFMAYLGAIFLMILVWLCGIENKGASRWISIFGFSMQPSEFMKPAFVMVTAWLFAAQKKYSDFHGNVMSGLLFVFTVYLLYKQPDFGMAVVVSVIWGFQFFLAGLPMVIVGILAILGVLGTIGAYYTLPHVQTRVEQFFSNGNNLSYQVKRSMEAFENGGFFGMGPGEGTAKMHLPDAHTDFIFAVAAEEYGMMFCLLIVLIYAVIVIRSIVISSKDNNLFILLAAGGLAASFGMQGIINMASTMHIAPTKGMALPLISYGGSSLLASAFGMGMLLAITRKNVSAEEKDEY